MAGEPWAKAFGAAADPLLRDTSRTGRRTAWRSSTGRWTSATGCGRRPRSRTRRRAARGGDLLGAAARRSPMRSAPTRRSRRLFACVDAVAGLLGLDSVRAARCCASSPALERLPRLAGLRSRLFGCGEDMAALVGRLAGADAGDAARRVRRSGPVALGLLFTGDGASRRRRPGSRRRVAVRRACSSRPHRPRRPGRRARRHPPGGGARARTISPSRRRRSACSSGC